MARWTSGPGGVHKRELPRHLSGLAVPVLNDTAGTLGPVPFRCATPPVSTMLHFSGHPAPVHSFLDLLLDPFGVHFPSRMQHASSKLIMCFHAKLYLWPHWIRCTMHTPPCMSTYLYSSFFDFSSRCKSVSLGYSWTPPQDLIRAPICRPSTCLRWLRWNSSSPPFQHGLDITRFIFENFDATCVEPLKSEPPLCMPSLMPVS
jgi:hypothetical protein